MAVGITHSDKADRNGFADSIGFRRLRAIFVVTVLAILQGCGQGNNPAPPKVMPVVEQNSKPGTKPGTLITNSIGMKLALIPEGEFLMGSPANETGRFKDELQHRVRITRPFYLGLCEVTQEEWTSVMGTTPWKGGIRLKEGDRYPATYVSWKEATEFCRKLTEMERRSGPLRAGESYRLPTEAEWEYACRAGSTTRFHFGDYQFGDGGGSPGEYAWFRGNTLDVGEDYAHEVGLKDDNAWGLFDVCGNVSEWCSDWYGEKYYGNSPVADPEGPTSGDSRAYRSGGWSFYLQDCRSAFREGTPPSTRVNFLGFRVARSSSRSQ